MPEWHIACGVPKSIYTPVPAGAITMPQSGRGPLNIPSYEHNQIPPCDLAVGRCRQECPLVRTNLVGGPSNSNDSQSKITVQSEEHVTRRSRAGRRA